MSTKVRKQACLGATLWESDPIAIQPGKGGTNDVPPFQGLGDFYDPTQGVALGWLVAGPLALHFAVYDRAGNEFWAEAQASGYLDCTGFFQRSALGHPGHPRLKIPEGDDLRHRC